MLFYGLVGENLTHSFSKRIHSMLGSYFYDLFSVDKNKFNELINKREFGGLNITIPYKQSVLPMCDVLSDNAREIGSVNTVVNKNGKIYGYNTDYLGFNYMLKENGFDLANKKVLILGGGGTSLTASVCAKNAGASEVVIVSRSGKNNYENISKHFDSQIIINTTPVGMFPNNSQSLINLSNFEKCVGVVDVIYNPLSSRLLLQARELEIPYCNGLLMLVAQAKYASELFFDTNIPDEKIMQIYKTLSFDLSNIILIGMPSCGKTRVGKQLASTLNRPFIDTDAMIENNAKMTIPEIFEKYGETEFRRLEEIAIKSAGAKNGVVIATGGGAVLKKENCYNLKQNGTMVFIKRDIEKLSSKGRPLSQNPEAIKALYNQRLPIYNRCGDIIVLNNNSVDNCVQNIIEELEEAFI